MNISDEQRGVIDLPLGPLCVTACAGSGKTTTATHRLREMRRLLDDRHGLVALLSFSNVAVNTFRADYHALARTLDPTPHSRRVEIDTVDGFLTTNVLRPHAFRTMQASRTPFLVRGREPFLRGFTVFDGKRSRPTIELRITYESGAFQFSAGASYAPVAIGSVEGRKAVEKLGKVGAYTHDSGRFWAIRTLEEQPFVLRALARRYPLILVDEAQDIGKEHQRILEMLMEAGAELSLIGDPNQGIYDFSGANGDFLASYGARPGVTDKGLTTNFRSVESIVLVANKLAVRSDVADRKPVASHQGAYFATYDNADRQKLLEAFNSMLLSAQVSPARAAILCRSSQNVEIWRGAEENQGQGIMQEFVAATVFRDKLFRFDEAFDCVCSGIVALLDEKHDQLLTHLARNADPEIRRLRRILWSFTRDSKTGLPDGSLQADTAWHSLLQARVKSLLASLKADFNLEVAPNFGHKLAKKALLAKPLVSPPDLGSGNDIPRFRVSTVHQVKGESIDGVMYVADKNQVRALLDGTKTELGRIGYVAVTRARDLMVLAVPAKNLGEFESELLACGFKKAGS